MPDRTALHCCCPKQKRLATTSLQPQNNLTVPTRENTRTSHTFFFLHYKYFQKLITTVTISIATISNQSHFLLAFSIAGSMDSADSPVKILSAYGFQKGTAGSMEQEPLVYILSSVVLLHLLLLPDVKNMLVKETEFSLHTHICICKTNEVFSYHCFHFIGIQIRVASLKIKGI